MGGWKERQRGGPHPIAENHMLDPGQSLSPELRSLSGWQDGAKQLELLAKWETELILQLLASLEVAVGDLCVDSTVSEESLAVSIILFGFNTPISCHRLLFRLGICKILKRGLGFLCAGFCPGLTPSPGGLPLRATWRPLRHGVFDEEWLGKVVW